MMQRSAPGLRIGLPAVFIALATPAVAQESSAHLVDLRAHGREPIAFVLDRLERHDLVVFDDALHTLVEPFDFYRRLVREPGFRQRARFVFLEAVPLNQQGHIEAYLAALDEDPRLLHPAFQNSVSGDGFPYATYFDLLRTIHEVNRSLRVELARRLTLLYSEEDLAAFIAESGASDLAGAIERAYVDRPREPLPQSRELPPLN